LSQPRPTKVNNGQRRPMTANDSQRRPTTANDGLRQPTKAYDSQRRPSRAHNCHAGQRKAKAGPQRPTMANVGPRPCSRTDHGGLETSHLEPHVCFFDRSLSFYATNVFLDLRTMTWPFATACTGTRQPRPLRRPMTALPAPPGLRTADAGPRQSTQAYSSPRGTGYGFFT
jgi:hypothetical protein